MSEASDTQPRPTSMRGEVADKKALAQIEKWMAVIRDISRERSGQTTLRG